MFLLFDIEIQQFAAFERRHKTIARHHGAYAV